MSVKYQLKKVTPKLRNSELCLLKQVQKRVSTLRYGRWSVYPLLCNFSESFSIVTSGRKASSGIPHLVVLMYIAVGHFSVVNERYSQLAYGNATTVDSSHYYTIPCRHCSEKSLQHCLEWRLYLLIRMISWMSTWSPHQIHRRRAKQEVVRVEGPTSFGRPPQRLGCSLFKR